MYIVEIGAGHGKLTFLLLRKLLDMKEFWPHDGCFKVVMTDFTEHNVNFWNTHAPLQKFFDAGLLDMAQFGTFHFAAAGSKLRRRLTDTSVFAPTDAVTDRELRLVRSKEVLDRSTVVNPIVVVSNYIFDTLKNDAFRVAEGELQQALCTVISSKAEPEPTHPDVISRIRCHWDYRPVTPESVYEDPHLRNVLRYYVSAGRDASILVPLGGIQMIDTIAHIANGRMMLLAGDKAYNHEEELLGLRHPHVAIHGSFSLMVNFHAVRLYVESRGGFARQTPHMDGFKCSSFVLGSAEAECPEYRYAWMDAMQTFGPDNFSTLQRCIKDETPAPTLKNALAVLRLSGYDSDIFYKFKQVLYDKAPYASEKQQGDIRRDVGLMYANYYPLQKTKDIAFEVGRLFMTLKLYDEAVHYFEDSQLYCGEHHVSWYNMGICYNYTNELEEALRCFSRSLEIASDYRDAQQWKARIEARMRVEAAAAARKAAAAPTSASDGAVSPDAVDVSVDTGAGRGGAGGAGDGGSPPAEAEGAKSSTSAPPA